MPGRLPPLAEEFGIARRVRFAGEVTEAALEALWHEADLFALATHWEGYGMAVAEALKRGVPVAVSAGGAAGNLVTPESGVVCPAGDHINLSKALRRLIFGAGLRRDDGGSGVAGWSGAAGLADAGAGIRRRRWRGDGASSPPTGSRCANRSITRRAVSRWRGAWPIGCPARPRLVDLGGGTGSLFRFLAPIIGRGQDWILVDADDALLEEAFGRTAAWARRQGFAATAEGDELSVSTPHGLWRMQAARSVGHDGPSATSQRRRRRTVMAGLGPAIHVFRRHQDRRGWPGQARP